jgi:hypothetical protein
MLTQKIDYLLIAGTARMGKSIIRKKLLAEHKIAGFCTDSLVSMLVFAEPEKQINFEMTDYTSITKYILGLLSYQSNYPMIFEGVGIYPKDWELYSQYGNIAMIGIGTPNILPKEKLRHIRNNSTYNEWTDKLSDVELLKLSEELIQESQNIQLECQKQNLVFFDLSKDFEKGVNQVTEYVSKVLGVNAKI